MSSYVGTEMYMAPEVVNKTVQYQGQDADNFAFGVLMLATKIEDYPWVKPEITDARNKNYRNLAFEGGYKADEFWSKYASKNLTPEFKSFIQAMLSYQPSTRPTIADILGDPWMRGPVMTKEEFYNVCKPIVAKATKAQEKELVDNGIGIDFQVGKGKQIRRGNAVKERLDEIDQLTAVNFRPQEPQYEHYGRCQNKNFTLSGGPIIILSVLFCTLSQEKQTKTIISKENWKFTYPVDEPKKNEDGQSEETKDDANPNDFTVEVELHEVDENEKYVVSVTRKGGSLKSFNAFNEEYGQLFKGLSDEEQFE